MILLNVVTDLARLFNTDPITIKVWVALLWGAFVFIFCLVVYLIASHKNSKRPKAPWFIP